MSALDQINLLPVVAPICVVSSKYCYPEITVYRITESAENNTNFEIREFIQKTLILKATREKLMRLVLRDGEDTLLLNLRSKMRKNPEVDVFRGNEKTEFLGNLKINFDISQFRASVKYTDSLSFDENCIVVKGIDGSTEVAVYFVDPAGNEVPVATIRRLEGNKSKSYRELRVAPRVDVAFIVALCLAIDRTVNFRQTFKKIGPTAAKLSVTVGIGVVKAVYNHKST